MDWQSMSGLREGMCQGIGKEDTVAIMPGLSRQEIFERQAGCHFVNPLTLALQEKRELVSVSWDSKGKSSAPGRKGLGGAVVARGLPALFGECALGCFAPFRKVYTPRLVVLKLLPGATQDCILMLLESSVHKVDQS